MKGEIGLAYDMIEGIQTLYINVLLRKERPGFLRRGSRREDSAVKGLYTVERECFRNIISKFRIH